MNSPIAQLSAARNLRVTTHEEKSAFLSLSTKWQTLESRYSRGPFSSFDWTRVWLSHFAPDNPMRVLEVTDGLQSVGFAPFIIRRGRLLGVPVHLWQSPSNEHSQRVEWCLNENAAHVVQALWEDLRQQDWEMLLIKDVIEEGVENQVLTHNALRDGFLVWQWPSLDSPWLKVPSTHTELAVSSKFKSNLRRRRKKLLEHGAIRLERTSDSAHVTRTLDIGLQLEASGWKGEAHTAILSSQTTAEFYRELADIAAKHGWLSLYLLYAGDKAVAFHFGLVYRDQYFLLKPGYDESLKECSAGQLLVEEVLADLSQRGVSVFDFLGPQMDWKTEWTDKVHPHTWTFILRPTAKGKWLYSARFHLGPQIKQWLTQRLPWTR